MLLESQPTSSRCFRSGLNQHQTTKVRHWDLHLSHFIRLIRFGGIYFISYKKKNGSWVSHIFNAILTLVLEIGFLFYFIVYFQILRILTNNFTAFSVHNPSKHSAGKYICNEQVHRWPLGHDSFAQSHRGAFTHTRIYIPYHIIIQDHSGAHFDVGNPLSVFAFIQQQQQVSEVGIE